MQSGGYYKIKKAFDGKEALEIIKTDKPDLILMDVMIPEIDGFSLCKLIKNDEHLNSIQIIMLTAKKMEEDILQGFENGAVDYISKPFSNKILLARIKAHLLGLEFNSGSKIYKNISLDNTKKTVTKKIISIQIKCQIVFGMKHLPCHVYISGFIYIQQRVYTKMIKKSVKNNKTQKAI